MNPTANLTANLIAVCDDLLRCVGQLRAIADKSGPELPAADVKNLINRLLDTRLQLSPPKTKPQHQTNNIQ